MPMKAMLLTRFGPPEAFQLAEIETPQPGPKEVLIRVRASTVTAGDSELRRLALAPYLALPLRLYLGPIRPRIKVLGQELSGVVEAVGAEVTRFQPGDEIIALPGFNFGAYAEYCLLPEDSGMTAIIKKPASWGFDQAATLGFGGLDALDFINRANLRPGQTILINGAGGSIGTYAIQFAHHLGAEVTAVDSAEKLEMLRSIGAAHTIDYRQQDFTQVDQRYDVVFDVIGSARFNAALRTVKPGGLLLNANPKLGFMLRAMFNPRVITGESGSKYSQLPRLIKLAESSEKELKAVIDKRYPLDALAEAHRYVDTGAKAGHVVIQMD